MSNYVMISPFEGVEQLAQDQWVSALRKMGHHVEIHHLRTLNVDPRADLPNLISKVVRHSPEILFVNGAIGFNLPEFFLDPSIQSIPVAAFWFDDPLRPLEFRQRQPGFLDALRLANVHHFVWDGYWRKWLMTHYQIRSFPIHLAADPEEFHPLPRPEEFQNHAVFIGTLASPRYMEKEKSGLPSVLQRVASSLPQWMEAAAYGTNPYEILDRAIQELPVKIRLAFDSIKEKEPNALLRLRSYIWKLGKNEVRKRMLREALKVAPVLILSGNLEQTHADENEIRQILQGACGGLTVKDTRDFKISDLKKLYAFGRIHLQATDPQSIEGGIPFRVFQTTAACRALFTDKKPELAECFAYGKEIFTFDSEKDVAENLHRAIQSKEACDRVAESGHQRFLKEHTWEHRVHYMMNAIRAGARKLPAESHV